MITRNEKQRKVKSKRIVAAGIVSLTVILTASAGVSYADIDLAGTMASWFNKKTEQVIQNLDQSMKSETDVQKELLKKELQVRLEASARNLESFTEEQKKIHVQALAQYTQALLAQTNVRTEQDRQQITDKLQLILDSAKSAMDTLAGSYVPPAQIFAPSPPVIVAPPVPIPTPKPPAVTDDVYGNQLPTPTVVNVTYTQQ
ncbi:hypothetical protein GCM10008018_29010 [Paenibacillus marchantiophytorum]|uniref:Molecular chaperone Skp n=1 Tax=Paenibacillus marchantiophytorum TaxID=1619310 RepID=A0ABQ1EQ97_9BACL|nr:hypothetical protein [Paenibacillus marchantiophytorum]GFZ81477.1 hypothetical protein GCM10008018_29010 [Paenibacillus marchantiophytorum]